MELAYFILGVICYQLLKLLAQIINRAVIERRRKRFLNLVKVQFPDHTKITFVGIDSSDKRAMDKMVAQLKVEGDILEEDVEDYHKDPQPKTSREKHDI